MPLFQCPSPFFINAKRKRIEEARTNKRGTNIQNIRLTSNLTVDFKYRACRLQIRLPPMKVIINVIGT